MVRPFCIFKTLAYYAALLPRRGPHIASHSVCLSVCLSVRPVSGCTLFTVAPSYDRTSKIEKLRFSLMGQRHICTFRHAQRAAYRTAISAAQTCYMRPSLYRAMLRNGTVRLSAPFEHVSRTEALVRGNVSPPARNWHPILGEKVHWSNSQG